MKYADNGRTMAVKFGMAKTWLWLFFMIAIHVLVCVLTAHIPIDSDFRCS